MELTPKQERFVGEYLIDLNATQAAIRSGYSQKSAGRIGAELLKKTHISKAIARAREELEKRTLVSQDKIILSLVEILQRCMQHVPVCDLKGNQIQDNEGRNVWEFNARDGVKALELLGKHMGLFQGNGTGRPQKNKEILTKFRDKELTPIEAAIEFEMAGLPLPRFIEILLGKQEPEPEDPTKGEYRTITDEEMEARVAERMANINAQLDGLPERREEIRELHKQVEDKFALGSKNKNGNGTC